LLTLNEFEVSLIYINKVLEIDPNQLKALIIKSDVLLHIHKFEEVIKVNDKLLTKDPINFKALTVKSYAQI